MLNNTYVVYFEEIPGWYLQKFQNGVFFWIFIKYKLNCFLNYVSYYVTVLATYTLKFQMKDSE